ncbi:filamentous hemagglutinin N-terminal domain-containing protein [Glaciimonas sp. PCH181]|uniref:two-partner secretion domain-containing protein n=1 Tax=Glaciimonas sp. PCH181 TaxID=2133943 RepID=UPI000D3D4FFD|nr:filamentous hemagglutinin N-terminal domain-containing protein [Glaciimonas sp. PCH181]PUA18082.1 hypothetical protein C7W93_19855 [Glaciimonas sp. PCH181]
MNKQAYRVIFNQKRGMLMAVAETVASQGKSTGAGGMSRSGKAHGARLLKLIYLSVAIAAVFGSITVVHAQIVALPNAGAHRPTIDRTANGRPLVQIVAPNAAGVSHNHYQQFNVDRNGAILNNARGIVKTQQGGLVDGNPYLHNGSARIILNEVRGGGRSQLNGYTEVAGQRAVVIIANPNGISCSGCGFINTTRGMLTTGMPQFGGDGSLNAFRVTGGDIQVGDMHGGNIDQVDLIARSVKVNGQLWAKQLNVIAGANQVNYADLGVQLIQGQGAAPTVGIDVAQLGGMYAGKIRLVGTGAGVGVVSLGTIAASAGDISIDSHGKITLNGKTSASSQIALRSDGDIANSGTLYARQAMQLRSAGQLSNSGDIAAQSDLTITATDIASTGTLAAGANAEGKITQAGKLMLTASGGVSATGENTAGGNLAITGSSINLNHAQTSTLGDVDLRATAGDIDHTGGNLQASGTTTLDASGALINDNGIVHTAQFSSDAVSLSNVAGKIIQSGTGDTRITTRDGIDNTGGMLSTNAQHVRLQAANVKNDAGRLHQGGTGSLALTTGTLGNVNGIIDSNGNLTLSAAMLDNQRGQVRADGSATVAIAGDLNNIQGVIQTDKALLIDAVNIDNSAGRLVSLNADGLTITASGEVLNLKGTTADSNNPEGGRISGNGNVMLTAANVRNSGNIIANHDLNVNVSQLFDNSGGRLAAANTLQLHAAELTNAHGALDASRIDATVAQLDNNAGNIIARQLSLLSTNLSNQHGSITHFGQDASLIAVTEKFDNSNGGTLQVNSTNLTLASQSLNNDGGTIAHAGVGSLNINVGDSALHNQLGSIASNGRLAVTATSIDNRRGHLRTARDVVLNIAGDLNNTQGTIQAEKAVEIDATNVDNSAGRIISLSADGLMLNASGQLTNIAGRTEEGSQGGTLGGNGDVRLNATNIVNSGLITAKDNLNATIKGSLDNDGGRLAAGKALQLQAAALTNVKGLIDASTVNATIAQLDNTAGKMSAGHLTIHSNSLSNQQGAIAQFAKEGTTVITVAGTLDNSNGGTIQTRSTDAIFSAKAINNDTGTIDHAGNGGLTVDNSNGNLSNQKGHIATNGNLALKGSDLQNQRGKILANSELSLALDGDLNNTKGTLQAQKALHISAIDINNSAGRIASLNADGLMLDASGQLTNTANGTIGGNGDVMLHSANLMNSGDITAKESLGAVVGDALNNSDGRLAAGKTLQLQAAVLTNENGLIDAATVSTVTTQLNNNAGKILATRLAINSHQLTNQQGQIAQFGSGGATVIAIAESLDNSRSGTIQANSIDFTLGAKTLNNDSGAVIHTGEGVLDIKVDGGLSNKQGRIASTGGLMLAATNIDNQRGQLLADGDAVLTVADDLDNTQGSVRAAKALQIYATDIDNSAGRLTSENTDGFTLNASGQLKNIAGIAADGAAGGVIGGNGDVNLRAGMLHNSGDITANDNLDVAVDNLLDNSSGRIAAGKALQLQAAAVINRQGRMDAARINAALAQLDNNDGRITANQLSLHSTDLSNQRGSIIQLGREASSIDVAESLDNSDGGLIHSNSTDLSLTPKYLNNDGGVIALGGTGVLNINLDRGTAMLHNSGGNISSNGQLTVVASAIDNRSGVLSGQQQTGILATQSDIDNSAGGYVGGSYVVIDAMGHLNNAGGKIEAKKNGLYINANSLNNAAGTVQSLREGADSGALSMRVAHRINNGVVNGVGGFIGSAGTISVHAAEVNNSGGTVYAKEDLTVYADSEGFDGFDGGITNIDGVMQSGTALRVEASGAVLNHRGRIEANGRDAIFTVSGSSLDNTAGRLVNEGTGLTQINGGNKISNTNVANTKDTGIIGGNGDVILTAMQLDNSAHGQIIAAGNVKLQISQHLDNNAGTLYAGRQLQFDQRNAALTNIDGNIGAAGNIALTVASLDNTQGLIGNTSAQASTVKRDDDGMDGDIALEIGNTLTNDAGTIGSARNLRLNANALSGEGKVIAGQDGAISLQGDYVNTAGNRLSGNRDFVFATTGNLTNSGDIEAVRHLTLRAANVDNQHSGLINAGDGNTIIRAAGGITNTGRIYGNDIALGAQIIINDVDAHSKQAGVIAARNTLNIGAQNIINRDHGLLQSMGDMMLGGALDVNNRATGHADTILNASATIDAGGALRMATAMLINQNNHFSTEMQVDPSKTLHVTEYRSWAGEPWFRADQV